LGGIADLFNKKQSSKERGKERLRLVLTIDRTSLSPRLMEMLKNDIIKLLSRYMVIDESNVQLNFKNFDDQMALVVGVPVIMARRERAAALPDN